MFHFRIELAGVVLAIVLVNGSPDGESKKALKPRNDLPGLKNFAKVSPILYRGAQPTREGFAELKRIGIKTVVNLRWLHGDRELIQGLGFQYVHIACQTWNPEDKDVAGFLHVLRDPKNCPVFVHCQHGADRTGLMCAVYRMTEGWENAEAATETHNFGFHKIWTDITAYLVRFDRNKIAELLKKTKEPKVEVVN